MQALIKRAPWVFKLLQLLQPIAKIFGWKNNVTQDWQQKQILHNHPTARQLLFLRQLPEI